MRSGITGGDELTLLISRSAARSGELFSSSLPMLRRGADCPISLNHEQVACILANALLCTFPEPAIIKRVGDHGKINLWELYGNTGATAKWKLGCLVSYLKRACHGDKHRDVVTYRRVSLDGLPRLEDSEVDLSTARVVFDEKLEPIGVTGTITVIDTDEIYGRPVSGSGCQAEVNELFYPR